MSDESIVESYRPQSWGDVAGQNSSIKEIRDWVENFPDEGTEPRLLEGPAGTGKSSTAEVAANEMGWPLLTFNASDNRTSSDIRTIAESMAGTPIDAEHSIILLDEVDSQSGQSNLKPLLDQLDNPTNPIILTCNSTYDTPDSILNRCKEMKYTLRKDSIKAHVRDVAEAEGIDIDEHALGKLATRGGMRDALQDLQAASASSPAGFPNQVRGEDIDWDERDDTTVVYEATGNILNGTPYTGMDSSPPQLIRWLDKNIRDHLRLLEAGMSYEALSVADVQAERIKDSDYRMWKYAGALITQIANLRLTEPRDNIWAQSPDWAKPPRSTGDSPEANLYNKLNDSRSFAFSGGFQEFRREMLPVLKSLDEEDRYRVVAKTGLTKGEMDVLDVDKSDYTDWRETVDYDPEPRGPQSASIDIGMDSGGDMSLSSFGETESQQQEDEEPEVDEPEVDDDDDDGMGVLGDFS